MNYILEFFNFTIGYFVEDFKKGWSGKILLFNSIIVLISLIAGILIGLLLISKTSFGKKLLKVEVKTKKEKTSVSVEEE